MSSVLFRQYSRTSGGRGHRKSGWGLVGHCFEECTDLVLVGGLVLCSSAHQGTSSGQSEVTKEWHMDDTTVTKIVVCYTSDRAVG